MTKETLTISKIIAEIKLSDAKIRTLINSGLPVIQKRNGELIAPKKKTEAEFIEVAKKFNAGLTGLLIRKFALKAALIKANAEVKFTFNKVEYTIAEAITKKDYLSKELGVYRSLMQVYTAQEQKVTRTNEMLENEVQAHLDTLYGSDTAKKSTPQADEAATAYRKARGVELFDPCNFEDSLPKKIEEIEDFFAGIDNRLSEINAITEVEFEY